jgi:uncharacterized protein (TIGR02996 family)
MRIFVLGDGRQRRVWTIDLRGESYTVRAGRIGDKRRVQHFECADAERAQQEHERKIKAKLDEGYKEVVPSPLQRSLEDALKANPDDQATHMAYADYLTEQGDPRGEFIRIQLALENQDLSAEQRQQLSAQMRDLYMEHAAEWLGATAHYVFKQHYRNWKVRFIRGWLGEVETDFLPAEGADALAWEPQARMLRRLVTRPNVGEEGLRILAGSPHLSNVRVLGIGSFETGFRSYASPDSWISDHGDAVWLLAQKMPKLEELYVEGTFVPEELFRSKALTHLRIFQWHGGDHYPLEVLARNESLRSLAHLSLCPRILRRRRDYRFDDFTGPDETEPILRLSHLRAILRSPRFAKLTHLRFQQSDIGDRGCREIVSSGILSRLKFLDLSGGCITDAGARVLAACPEARNLEQLVLSFNALTGTGVRALQAATIQVEAVHQYRNGSNGYLYREG